MAVVLAAADVVHVADFAGAFHATPASAVRCNDVVLVELAAGGAGKASGAAPLPVLGVPVDALRVTWPSEGDASDVATVHYALIFQDAHLIERAVLVIHGDRSGRAAPDPAPRLFCMPGIVTEMLVRLQPPRAENAAKAAANVAANAGAEPYPASVLKE